MPVWGAAPNPAAGALGQFLGITTTLGPPLEPPIRPIGSWAIDGSGRVWVKIAPGIWNVSLTIGTVYAPGQGGVIPGVKGYAVSFDGVSGKAATALVPSTGAWQLAGFIKSPAGGSGSQALASWDQGAQGAGAFIGAYNGAGTLHELTISDGTVSNFLGTGAALDDGAWHFIVAAVYGLGSDTTLFSIDGLNGNGSPSNAVAAGTSSLTLAYNALALTFGKVFMARMAFWDAITAPLTATVIANLYNLYLQGNARNFDAELLKQNPTAYWLMQETVGNTMADDSGNANAGAYAGGFTLGVEGPM